MTDLRDQLNEAWTSAEQQSAEPEKVVATSEDNQTATAEPVEVITAPNSYTKEAKDWFATLPQDNQRYLAEREKQYEQGLSRARNQYSWVDKVYNDRKEALAQQGYKSAQDYINDLVLISDALNKNPSETIKALQTNYGLTDNGGQQTQDNALLREIKALQETVSQQQSYLNNQQQEKIAGEYNSFVNAKDDNGNLKHAYFEDVKAEMANLFNAGLAKNFEDAYNQAIWRVESVRDKLIAEKAAGAQVKNEAVTQKAKTAAFEPSAKAEPTPKKRSLREEIEHNMAIYGDE
jgi:hypothetical protein